MNSTLITYDTGTGGTIGWINQRDTQVLMNRLYIVKGGEGYYSVFGEKRRFHLNHCYILPAMCPYELMQNDENPFNHTYVNFIIDPPILSRTITDLNPQDNYLQGTIIGMIDAIINSTAILHHANFYICPSIQSSPLHPLLINAVQTLLQLARLNNFAQSLSTEIQRSVEYIHQHYYEKISVDSLSKLAFMEKSYYIAKFKNEIGYTPYQYIQKLRLSTALILRSQGISLNQASESAGFSSVSSLYRAMNKK